MELNETQLTAKDLNQQGIALAKTRKIDEAVAMFNKAIDIEPMLIDSYRNLGDLYLHLNQYKEAKNYYKKALLIEKSGEIYFQYGNACFLNDEEHEGLEYYNLALSAGFDDDDMLFYMGLAYEHMNDDAMALRYIQKALSKNPSRPDYKVKKISLLLRMNKIEEADKNIDELILNDPELYDGYHMKTTLLLETQQYEEAAKFAKVACDKFPEDADLLYDYANAVALTGNYSEAHRIIANAERLEYFNDVKHRYLLLESKIYAQEGDMDNAIKKADECIALEGENEIFGEARFLRINMSFTVPDFEAALANAEKIVNKGDKNPYYYAALYYVPYCMKKLGKEAEAKAKFEEAVKLFRMITLQDPSAIDAYLYRTMCLKDLAKYDEAFELLDFMEKLNPELAEIFTIRAEIYKLKGNETLMKEELEKAFKFKPELREAYNAGGN